MRGVVTSPNDEAVDVDETDVEREGDGGGGTNERVTTGEVTANEEGV